MFGLKVETNAGRVAKQFGSLADKQIPFATARALTWTAQDGQREVRRELPHHFVLRNRFLEQSVGITAATKLKWTSVVGFRTSSNRSTDFMNLQQDGGLKTPKRRVIAVPVNARRNKKQLIPKGQKPKAVLKKKNTFIGEPNGRMLGIYQRQGHHKLTMLYRLIPAADIKQRLGMDKTVDRVVKQRFERLFNLSLDMALRSTK